MYWGKVSENWWLFLQFYLPVGVIVIEVFFQYLHLKLDQVLLKNIDNKMSKQPKKERKNILKVCQIYGLAFLDGIHVNLGLSCHRFNLTGWTCMLRTKQRLRFIQYSRHDFSPCRKYENLQAHATNHEGRRLIGAFYLYALKHKQMRKSTSQIQG